ncbi:MAG: hypothetical protein H6660_02105 [Ardenticatenaceae bacterium]|nr:hypothetical protein [Ardenticatenaceae bacterium]
MEEINQIANGVETNQEEPEPITLFAIAGFWRRLIAFIVDGFNQHPFTYRRHDVQKLAFHLGPYGRIFGNAIVIAYCNFITLTAIMGKHLVKDGLKSHVVDHQGKVDFPYRFGVP